ncbi:A24 family peptidase [Paenibacillus sp. 2TAB23]|uniref:prepilin peptidase n=1 Tax=Paenibacillus sp. 2TAB23 TaxID=3233004 RepID=UPI003F99E02F
MSSIAIIVFALLGLLVSGFLSAIAIQWDSRFQSLNPPIYALKKQTKQRFFGLLPLIKKIMSGINQRKIKPSLAWRYALGEFMTTVLFAHAAYTIGWEPELIAVLFFICILVIIVQTDLTDMIIPNKVVAVGVIGAIGIRLFVHPLPLLNYGIAALAGSGALLLIGMISSWILKKETMGGGDIKLYVLIGLILGVKVTLLSLFLASLFGLIGGIALLATGAHSKGKTIPFGPYIAAGALAAYYWGNGLIDWYLSLLSY